MFKIKAEYKTRFASKIGCLIFGGDIKYGSCCRKNHNKCHEILCNTSINWRLKPSSKACLARKIFFQHDFSKPHETNIVKQKIAKLVWKLLPHPPYSPDLATSVYYLFRSLSNGPKDKKYQLQTQGVLRLRNHSRHSSACQHLYYC